MTKTEAKIVDAGSWDSRSLEASLLSYGVVTEHVNANLSMYGYGVMPGVLNVEMMVDTPNLTIEFLLVVTRSSERRLKLQQKLTGGGLFRSLLLFFFLKMFGNYDPTHILRHWIKGYLGAQWDMKVEVLNAADYNEQSNGDRPQSRFLQKRDELNREVC